MALSSTRAPLSPVFPSSFFLVKPSIILFHKPLLKPRNGFAPKILSASSSFTAEQTVLEAVGNSNSNTLPAIRSYENDLAQLTFVGAVEFQQALTAAAADGGETADEHISSGAANMVVETIFPGPVDENSTISTRLFLPAKKVKEKAVKLKRSLTEEILSSTSAKNILAMTFRQVVLQQLWNVELKLFGPGTERDMSNLENPREPPTLLSLRSSDKRIISVISEVICVAALENTERSFLHASTKRASYKFFPWFKKGNRISSRDSSVILYNLLDNEILENAKTLVDKFNQEREKYKFEEIKFKSSFWSSATFSKLEKIGGPEFCDWISKCVPSFILKVDASRFNDVKFEGWKMSEATSWEVILTHSQMVGLADALDMYYEDVFTLPSEGLSCSAVAKSSNLLLGKGSSILTRFSISLARGIFLVAITVLLKVYLPYLPSRKSYIVENVPSHSVDVSLVPRYFVESSKAEACCVLVISKIKNFYGWPGEVKLDQGRGAYVGILPKCLSKADDIESNTGDRSSTSMLAESDDDDVKVLQDIASYRVVLSAANIVGFQPTNRVAVNNWAVNPLAKDLYHGKKLSPGFFEPGLNIRRPRDIVLLELLMSVTPESYFAFIRTVDISENVHTS